MSEQAAGIDAGGLELIERRLSEKVEANVRSRLFKSYLAMGAAVIAVLGYIGFDIVTEARKSAQAAFDKVNELYAQKIDDKLDGIKDKVTTVDVITDLTQRAAFNLQSVADAAKPQIAIVETYAVQVQDLNAKTKDLQSSLAVQNSTEASRIDKLSDQVSALALEVQKLAGAVGSGVGAGTASQAAAQQVASSTGDISSATKKIQAIIEVAKKPSTVFVQYDMKQETAETIAQNLKSQGFIVPGIDFETSAAGLSEVRYYYDADRPAAATLADAATRALRAAVPDAPIVTIRGLTDWPNRKPNPGILELWIGGPSTAASQ